MHEAAASWKWFKWSLVQLPPNKQPLLLNMDEMACRLFYDPATRVLASELVALAVRRRQLTQNASTAQTRSVLSLVAVLCNDSSLQPRLPQYNLDNEHVLQASVLGELRQMAPDSPRRPHIAPDGPRWLHMLPDGPRRPQKAHMAPEGSRWPQIQMAPRLLMAPYGPRLPQMAPYGPRWPQMAPDGPKWSQMAPDGFRLHRRPQMAPDGPSWHQMAPDGSRWPEMVGCLLGWLVCLVGWSELLVAWLVGLLGWVGLGWLVGCLVGCFSWLVGWLGWLVAWLHGLWLLGWLVFAWLGWLCWLVGCLVGLVC